MSFSDWMQAIQQRTEVALARFLPRSSHVPARLHEAMRYATLQGGKRVRPLLCHAAGSAFAADPATLDAAACAVEMIHAYSLVHDDLPAMDNDTLRRGKPTCHVAYDEATALLVGDALQAQAFHVLAQPLDAIGADRQLQMIGLLADAAGSGGMAGGQAIDLQSVGKSLELPELELMHIMKTGALIRAAVLLGAHAGNASAADIELLVRYANRAGLLFQVIDDILDAEADTATLGKTAGKDATENKPTNVSLLGSGRARDFAEELRRDAIEALSGFGARTDRLRQLTDYIVARSF